jgi:tight adherence protein B
MVTTGRPLLVLATHRARVRIAALAGPVSSLDRPSRRRWLDRWAVITTRWQRRRRPDDDLRDLASALEDLARSLRGGASLAQALAEVAVSGDDPVRRELRRVDARVDAGAPLSEALADWRASSHRPGVALAVGALDVASRAGGSRAQAVDQVAATLRERLALADELRAQSSQARLSALVLVVCPAVFAALAASVDPRVVAFLVTHPFGWGCLAIGLALEVVGGWWMARITGGSS